MTENSTRYIGRNEFVRRYQFRLDVLFTGELLEAVIAGEATTLFRKHEWFELALDGNLDDAPYLADASKADTDEDRVAVAAWAVWMKMVERDRTRELIIGAYRPEEVPEGRSEPVAAVCAPDWSSIGEANPNVEAIGFADWVCFSVSDRWALFCYCEGISILGGSPEYMSEFRSLLGGFGRLREAFVDVAERQLVPAWVNDDYRKLPGLIRWPPG